MRPRGKKYGAPLYAIEWSDSFAYMCGGGNNGIENKVVVIQRDEKQGLTEEITKFNLGDQTSDVPYRMKLHPSGSALVVTNALGGIKVVRIDRKEGEALPALTAPLPAVAKAAEKCSFVGTIKSLSFSSDGTRMALGADDGKVHIMSWPALDKKGVIDVTKTTTKGIRNLDFSAAHDDRLILVVDEWGSCFLYDVDKLKLMGELEKPVDMPRMKLFRVVSGVEGKVNVLYGVGNCNKLGYALRWKQVAENEGLREDHGGETSLHFKLDKVSKALAPSPVCGCALSHDGSTLAVVTPDAEQAVFTTDTLKRIKFVKGAHMTFATAVGYTEDDDAIVSVSADGSAVLTSLDNGSDIVIKMLIFALIMALLALLVHLFGRETVKAQPEKTLDIVSILTNALRRLT